MNRVNQLFGHKKEDVLTVYFTAGYPNLNDTAEIIQQLDKSGVDLIEVGMPYSDPLADGPTIQQSSKIALENGMTLQLLFEQLAKARNLTEIPLVLMGYYNQVLQYGIENFCKKCSEVGVDGLILPDVPIEEFEKHLQSHLEHYNLTFTFLITPATPDERIKTLDKLSSGFLYAVANHAITGSKIDHSANPYGDRLTSLELKNPVMVGFGIATARDVESAGRIGNGCIVGSAFIKALAQEGTLTGKINEFITSLKTLV